MHLGQKLSPSERREVLEDLFVFGKDNQRPFLYRMAVLLVISTVIATCGLLSNSAAVVIGAMLVAPMMRPVMAAAAAITGRIMGATSMAPITTAAEFDSKPQVAITVEITSNTAMR